VLALTRKTEYALIAACHLARVGNKVVSAREIAAQHAVPLPLLMNVLKLMNQGGHVRSVRGAHGGYLLARPANQISLADVIEAVEGPVRLVRCAPPGNPTDERNCELVASCTIRRSVRRVHDRLHEFLAGVTVADVAFETGALEGLKMGALEELSAPAPELSTPQAMAQ
jgi:Rrf2 family protein